MASYEAVLFDGLLTLAAYPTPREHLRRADEVLGRTVDAEALDALTIAPSDALMGGDRAGDGAAADLGVDTLLLLACGEPAGDRPDRLGAVLQLVRQ